MIHGSPKGDGSSRVVAQFLEGGVASAAIDPDAAIDCLQRAAAVVPLTDLCLGWNLPPALVEAVAGEAHRLGQRVWLWQPLLSGDGRYVPGADAARGPGGAPIPWPRGMAEFAFDCPVRAAGRDAALARLEAAVDGGPWDGVLLDKMRWPSPTRDPAADLACFCDACRSAAASAGIDMGAVAGRLDAGCADGAARIDLLRELLGIGRQEPLASFMSWRAERITDLVAEAARLVTTRRSPDGSPLHLALDVYSPSLAGLVGQDISELTPLGELTKAMTYLGTHGPAGLPYELCGLARWLAAGDVQDPTALLASWLGYPLPDGDRLCTGTLGPAVFERELLRLRSLAGSAAAAGVDAVDIADVGLLDDQTLGEVARIAGSTGTTVVLSWDLWAIPEGRLARVTRSLAASVSEAASA